MSDLKKPLAIAKSVLPEIKKMVDLMFTASEVDRAKDEKAYFEASNAIFAAICACAAQRMLDDGLMTGRLRTKLDMISPVARELFLSTHPEIVAKIATEKAAAAVKAAQESNSFGESDEDEEEYEGDEDESGDE